MSAALRGRGWLAFVATAGVALASAGAVARSEVYPAALNASVQRRLLHDPALALKRARQAQESGDNTRAEWLLTEVGKRHPIVGDYAALELARVLLAASEPEKAEVAAAAGLKGYPDSPLGSDFHELRGDALAKLERFDEARAAWSTALDDARGDERRAVLLLMSATSFEAAGKLAEAGESYSKLWSGLPTTEQAEQAGKRLDVLERRKQTVERSAEDWRRRGDQFFRRRYNAEALDAYDRALAGGLSKSQARSVGKQRAHTLFRMRRYPEAVEAFTQLEQTDDVPLWRARSLARAGEVPQAVKELEALAKKSRGELGLRATYLAALLLDGRKRHVEANRHFETVASNKVSAGLQNAALWHLGWAAYRAGRLTEAIDYYDRLLEQEDDAIGALRARYWRARVGEQLEPDREEVREQYRAIAREFPLTYYGWRAQARVRGGLDGRPPAEVIHVGSRAIPPEKLERPRILIGADLLPEASNELDLLARDARGLNDRLELAQLYRDAGEYHSAQRLVVDAYTENLARGPVPKFEELWWHAWPFAFGDLVDASTRSRENIDPGLVFSIMREESGYRAEVVSPNGARGLLQIMEETGERLARSTGVEPFSADDLFVPRVNIDLGSFYLAELRNRFDGRLSATIASYNAGPNAVAKWVKEESELEDDEWVEAIPYDQTRGYVKRVLRSVHAYQVLY